MTYKVAMADDHNLLRNGLANLINSFEGFEVVLQASNGKELLEKINPNALPHIVLLDINMPIMDGFKTAEICHKKFPLVKILALSMMDSESAIIRMIKNGARGYVLKDSEPGELKSALNELIAKGFYYNELVTGKLIFTINKLGDQEKTGNEFSHLSEKEIQFLKLICTELTYKEIADQLGVSVRTVDGYRDTLFDKLNVKSRVGLVMYAVRQGIVNV